MTDYLLGHRDEEWQRLQSQHELWRDGLLGTLTELGLGPGCRVLDAGCGSGALLADLVAAGAKASGLEQDGTAAAAVRERLGVEVRHGDLRESDLGGPYDLIVVRWVFSFLPNPGPVIDRLIQALAPNGRLVIQDYNHEGIGVWPQDPAIHDIFLAFREAYSASGGDLWIAAKLPQVLASRGLPLHGVLPEIKTGAVDSGVWRWIETFLFAHLGSLDGIRSPKALDAFREAWANAREVPGARIYSPMIVTVVTGPKAGTEF